MVLGANVDLAPKTDCAAGAAGEGFDAPKLKGDLTSAATMTPNAGLELEGVEAGVAVKGLGFGVVPNVLVKDNFEADDASFCGANGFTFALARVLAPLFVELEAANGEEAGGCNDVKPKADEGLAGAGAGVVADGVTLELVGLLDPLVAVFAGANGEGATGCDSPGPNPKEAKEGLAGSAVGAAVDGVVTGARGFENPKSNFGAEIGAETVEGS